MIYSIDTRIDPSICLGQSVSSMNFFSILEQLYQTNNSCCERDLFDQIKNIIEAKKNVAETLLEDDHFSKLFFKFISETKNSKQLFFLKILLKIIKNITNHKYIVSYINEDFIMFLTRLLDSEMPLYNMKQLIKCFNCLLNNDKNYVGKILKQCNFLTQVFQFENSIYQNLNNGRVYVLLEKHILRFICLYFFTFEDLLRCKDRCNNIITFFFRFYKNDFYMEEFTYMLYLISKNNIGFIIEQNNNYGFIDKLLETSKLADDSIIEYTFWSIYKIAENTPGIFPPEQLLNRLKLHCRKSKKQSILLVLMLIFQIYFSDCMIHKIIIENGIVDHICELINEFSYDVEREACVSICNFIYAANPETMTSVLKSYNILDIMIYVCFSSSDDPKIVKAILSTLLYIIRTNKSNNYTLSKYVEPLYTEGFLKDISELTDIDSSIGDISREIIKELS